MIPGDVTRNEVWDHLEGLLLSEYLHASGLPMRIVATCIDCGFKDATVLRFTRDRYNRRVYATKGRAGESPIWPRKPSRKNQTPFFMIGVDAAKTAIYDRLKIREAGAGILPLPDRARPGVLRAVDRREEVHAVSQRLSEAGMAEAGQRPERRRWTRGYYAYAALHALYASGLKLPVHCDRFARMVAGAARRDAAGNSGSDAKAGQHRAARSTCR